MIKKLVIIVITLVLLIIGVIGYLYFKPVEYYDGVATITEKNDDISVYAKLDSIEDSNNENIIIQTNIFKVNDKLNVKYYKKGRKYHIASLGLMINNDENTTKQLVKTINKDQKLNEYKKLVECKQELENGNLAICQNLCILPDKISNQKFNEIISLNNFLKYQFLIRPFLGTPKDQKLILTFKEPFEIIKLESVRMENIHVINNPQDMDYQLENNSIIVKSLNTATFYILKIKFSNSDIINYVFL